MGIHSKTEETLVTTTMKSLLSDEYSVENTLDEGIESDEILEALKTNLLVLEGLQNRCSYVLKEVRYMMKIEEAK